MGSMRYEVARVAASAEAAYASLVAEARQRHGADPESGTIAATTGFGMVAARPGETRAQTIDRVIDWAWARPARPGASRGPAACLDLGPAEGAPGQRRYVFFGFAPC